MKCAKPARWPDELKASAQASVPAEAAGAMAIMRTPTAPLTIMDFASLFILPSPLLW